MCDKQGFVRNEAGDVVGKAELVSEGDREGMKTGPFADFPDATVTKDGKVTSSQGIIGRLVEGDGKKLFSKQVDEDGDVLDKVHMPFVCSRSFTDYIPEWQCPRQGRTLGRRRT